MKNNFMKGLSLVVALLCFGLLGGCKDDVAETAVSEPPAIKRVPVEVEVVHKRNLQETFTLPVGLEAWEDLTIAAEISGVVEKIHYQEGDSVAAGDLLIDIDSKTIRSLLSRDQSTVEVLNSKRERYKSLLDDGLVSQQEYDDLENNLTAAKAALQATSIQMADSKPVAPVRGIVDRLYVDRGEFIERGKPLLRLVQVDRLKALANVPEKDVPFLRKGQKVDLIPAEILRDTAQTIQGTIEYIAYAADEATRTYRTRIILDNKDLSLRPGMIVRAGFVRRQLQDVYSAPLFSVIDRDGDKFLFVQDGDIAKEVDVRVGASIGDRVVIEEGLDAGQNIIIKGQQLLVDGAAIVVRGQ